MTFGLRTTSSSVSKEVPKLRKLRFESKAKKFSFTNKGNQVLKRGPCRSKKNEYLKPFSFKAEGRGKSPKASRKLKSNLRDLTIEKQKFAEDEKKSIKVEIFNDFENPQKNLSPRRMKRNPFESSIDWTETSKLSSLERRSDFFSPFTFRNINMSKDEIFSKSKLLLSNSFGYRSNSESESASIPPSCLQSPMLSIFFHQEKN